MPPGPSPQPYPPFPGISSGSTTGSDSAANSAATSGTNEMSAGTSGAAKRELTMCSKSAAREVPSSGYIGMRSEPSVNTAAARTVTSTPPAIIQNCRLRFDPFTDEAIADPYPQYDRFRTAAPVHWSEKLRSWVLFRHDDVVAFFRAFEGMEAGFRDRAVAVEELPRPKPALVPIDMLEQRPGDLDGARRVRLQQRA